MISTRLCKKSSGNNLFHIKDEDGKIIATIETSGERAELLISTLPEFHLEKPNGYTSKREKV